ncbi:hypothetical protein ACS0TY_026030 [Phlomoides rotata]
MQFSYTSSAQSISKRLFRQASSPRDGKTSGHPCPISTSTSTSDPWPSISMAINSIAKFSCVFSKTS